jgi:hypothetical protein
MLNPSENLPGIYLGAASLMCLVSYFGARNRRTGWRKQVREGEVTRLWLRWIYWNRGLAPENSSPAASDSLQALEQRPATDVPWRTVSPAGKHV